MGLIHIQNGDYSTASSSMSGTNDFNAALAKVLGGDAAGAQAILQQSADKDSRQGPLPHGHHRCPPEQRRPGAQ